MIFPGIRIPVDTLLRLHDRVVDSPFVMRVELADRVQLGGRTSTGGGVTVGGVVETTTLQE
jgi:hypothetical protein